MKKLLIVLVVLVGLFLWLNPLAKYNQMVVLDANVEGAWSQVENQYQRRLDLVPNLVETVKGAADFEQDTLTQVIEARASATKTDINLKDAQEFATFQESQSGLSSALSRLMVVMEQYPQLTATSQFSDLRVQIEGTENRIATERQRFNEVAKAYNIYIRQIPNNLWAALFGFDQANLFESNDGAEAAPKVDFSTN
ncbi:MAG TPA: LemA family protein [Candidatus Gracilibacteria bacterium]